jgi:putative acetyltransferase
MMTQIPVLFQPDDSTAPQVYRLIEHLDCYLASLYPAESNYLLAIETLQQPQVAFFTARVETGIEAGIETRMETTLEPPIKTALETMVVGCGALVNHGDYGELKRMYVLPEYRGLGIGSRLLAVLESWACDAGLSIIRLETGVAQPEALGLYQRSGYRPCEPFGDYQVDPLSIFLEKRLFPEISKS